MLLVDDRAHPVVGHLAPETDDEGILDDRLVHVHRIITAVGRRRCARGGMIVVRRLIHEQDTGNSRVGSR